MAKRRPSKARKVRKAPKPVDWAMVQAEYELEGVDFSKLARKYGCHRDTVARHAKKQSWRPAVEVHQAAADRAREKFVERSSLAILRTLDEQHQLNERIRKLIEKRITQLERPGDEGGEGAPDLDPLELRRLQTTLRDNAAVDHGLAGLSDDGWRSVGTGGDESSSADADAVRAVLDEVERD